MHKTVFFVVAQKVKYEFECSNWWFRSRSLLKVFNHF